MRYRRFALVVATLMVVAACGGGEAEPDQDGDPNLGQDAVEEAMEEALEGGDVDLPTEEDVNAASGDLFTGGTSGTATVDGESFDVNVLRCEPFSFGGPPHEDDLSVVYNLGSGNGGNIDLSFSEGFDFNTGDAYLQENLSVFYSTGTSDGVYQYEGHARNQADGTWYPGSNLFPEDEDPLPGPPYEISGNRISGGLTLVQSWPEGMDGTVEITFDLEIPDEYHPDC